MSEKVPGLMAVRAILRAVQRAKDALRGNKWRMMHRVESELATIAGHKSPRVYRDYTRAKAKPLGLGIPKKKGPDAKDKQ